MVPLQQKGSSQKQGRGQLGLRARYWTQGEQKIRKPTFPGQEKREKGECRETGRPRNRVFRLNLFINKFGCFVLFCFVLCDRQHSSSGHMAHHRPRMCAAGHTPHPLCGAVRRPRVRLQPIRIREAFAGRDAQSAPSESLTGSVMSDTPLPGPRRAGTRVPSRMVLYGPAR